MKNTLKVLEIQKKNIKISMFNPLSEQESDCQNCTKGMMCTKTGLETPDKECVAGYFCPEGQSIPQRK